MNERPEIVRVWGSADSFDIEFRKGRGDKWFCLVPPDTADGIYAVEIWALNEHHETAYYTAELYMCNGICHLRLKREPYRFIFLPPQVCFALQADRYSFSVRRCEHI